MNFFGKLQMWMARMMQGRNGLDNLGHNALITGLVLTVVDLFLGTGLLSMLGTALYIYSLFRLMSRNVPKRQAENQRYMQATSQWTTKIKQAWLRLKNSKQYKYFRCPSCRVHLRLTRGCGEKTVTCPKCRHQFRQKA